MRRLYELGVTYFDCARLYWGGRSEEAYGIGLQGVRKSVFLTTKSAGLTAREAAKDLDVSLGLLKTDYVDLWQLHFLSENREDIRKVFGPG